MSWIDDYPRIYDMYDQVAGEACQEGADGLSDFVKKAINDLSEIANFKYDQWMSQQKKRIMNPQPTVEELQQMIDRDNETMEIGRDDGVISVQFAMHKLGYTREQIDEVIKLARPSLYEREQQERESRKSLETDTNKDQTDRSDDD